MLLCLKTLSAKARCRAVQQHMAGMAAVQLQFKAVPVPRQGGRQVLAAADVPDSARRNTGGQCQGENAFFSGKVGCQQPAAARGQGAEHGHAARRSAEYRQQFALCQTRVAAGAQQAGHTVQKTLSVRPLLFQSAESRRRVRCDAARIAAPERRQAQAGGQIRRGAR